MTTIREPLVTVNKLPAVLPTALEDQKVLIIGQKLAAGSATTGIIKTNVLETQIDALFGQKSMIAEQFRQAFTVLKESGSAKIPRVDALPFADGGAATAAQGIITITEKGGPVGTASESGTLNIIIGSEQEYTIPVTITVGDAFTDIRTAIAAAINATTCPVTAAVNVNDIEIDFNNAGTVGNFIGLGFSGTTNDGTDEVLGNVIAAVTGFTGGATDPASADVDTALGLIVERYQTVCAPSQWAVASVKTWLNGRFNVTNEILDGVCITHKIDSVANLKTYAGTTNNNQSIVVLGDKDSTTSTYDGPVYREFDFAQICHVGVIRALRRTDDANLIKYVVNGQPFDLLGGAELASLPYHNTPLYNINVADSSLGFSKSEITDLNDNGVTVIGNNIANTLVLLGSMVTTYLKNAQSQDDPTWHYLNTVDTVSVAAEYFFNSFKRDYVQTRLTTGNLRAGRGVANEDSILASFKQYYLELADLLIVRDSDADIQFFLDSIQLSIDLLLGAVTANANLPIVVQLRSIVANLITTFDTGQ
jgi:phage tail sheath gpL-like